MNKNVYRFLQSHPHLLTFVRHNPMWYRYLSREPQKMFELEKEAKSFYGKTFPQRLEKVNDHIQLAALLIQMSRTMKD